MLKPELPVMTKCYEQICWMQIRIYYCNASKTVSCNCLQILSILFLTVASSFLLKQMRPCSSFKRQTHFFEWTTNTLQTLIVWGWCLNSYYMSHITSVGWSYLWFFDSLPVKLPSKKNFRKIFYWLKRSALKFQGESWGSFWYLTSSSGREARKTPSCLLKDKKGRNC